MIIWSIAKTTVGDALRKKVLQIFLVVAIGLILISVSFSQSLTFSAREGSSMDLALIKGFGLGLMAIAGWLISIVMGVSLIPQEIERRTIYTILSKPVKRYEFIIGKFLGAICTLAICVALMGVVFIAVVAVKAAGAQGSVASAAATAAGGLGDASGGVAIQVFDPNTLWGVVLVFMQFCVLTAVVMLLSVFLTPTVNFFMGMGVYIVGVMSPMIETLSDKHTELHSLLKGFYKVVHAVVPNFDKFNQTNELLHPGKHIESMPAYVGTASMYGLLYVLIMMTIAVIVFEKKEV